MDLQEIRNKINTIDDAMHELFDSRMLCSKEVAKVKMESNDSIFKPQREKEIMARFSGEEEQLYRLYVRKVMQLSRFLQYREFLLAGKKDEAFCKASGNVFNEAYGSGSAICVTFDTDPQSEHAISVPEVLSLLGDFGVTLHTLQVTENTVSFTAGIPKDATNLQHMELLFYMLFKETLQCKFYIEQEDAKTC